MRSIKQIRIWLMSSVAILLLATAISAQSAESSASSTQTTRSAADQLKECSQMLDQTLDELKSLKAYAASLEKRSAIDDAIQTKQAETIEQQGKLIAIYEKRRGTTISFFFGLIKVKKN